MFRHDRGDRVGLSLLLQVPSDPVAFGAGEYRVHSRLVRRERPIIEVRRVMEVPGVAIDVELHVKHAFRDDATITGPRYARVLNGVLKVEQHTRSHTGITLGHQYGASAEQVSVPLEGQVNHGVK